MKARTLLGEATRKHFHSFRTLSVSSSRKELAGSLRLLSLAFFFSVNSLLISVRKMKWQSQELFRAAAFVIARPIIRYGNVFDTERNRFARTRSHAPANLARCPNTRK